MKEAFPVFWQFLQNLAKMDCAVEQAWAALQIVKSAAAPFENTLKFVPSASSIRAIIFKP